MVDRRNTCFTTSAERITDGLWQAVQFLHITWAPGSSIYGPVSIDGIECLPALFEVRDGRNPAQRDIIIEVGFFSLLAQTLGDG